MQWREEVPHRGVTRWENIGARLTGEKWVVDPSTTFMCSPVRRETSFGRFPKDNGSGTVPEVSGKGRRLLGDTRRL